MTVQQLQSMLGTLDDTRELVLDAPQADEHHPLFSAWLAAQRRAGRALAAWRVWGGAEAYAAYRAASASSAAAQDVLAGAPGASASRASS
jgi:hypothetical protein